MIRVFKQAIEFLGERLLTVVEIGSIWHRNKGNGGHSTLEWPWDAQVWTCDVNPAATQLTATMTKDRPSVIAINVDGLKFLRMFQGRIDLLYLDGPFDKLQAYLNCQGNMAERCVVLIDDIDIIHKHPEEHVPELLRLLEQQGFERVEFDDCKQAMMVRCENDPDPEDETPE